MTPSHGHAIIGANAVYARLWRLALPYLDTRQNEVHTLISVGLASRLLTREEGNEQVVIPAVILHDVGWKRVPEELQLQAFGPKATDSELNRLHEIEGVRIARRLLETVFYERSLVCEILAIIDGHDSRSGAFSINDAVVKDADKLWRYSRQGLAIDTQRFGETYSEGLRRLRTHLDSWLLTADGRRLARELLRQRQGECTP